MKKVININFQGRVIPIEESAYETLKNYTESLRRYFANEEGKEEIINDIENRIAELFSDNLKTGSICITDADLEKIIDSMGRPEDFEQENAGESSGPSATFASSSATGSTGSSTSSAYANTGEPRRLYRAENDKVLGGVCAGLANYLHIDPAIMRILFAVVTLGGFGAGIMIYIVLWIILPKKDLMSSVRKRLFRNPEHKVLGGVASGIAAYFNIDTWIPRLVFLLPFLIGVVPSIFGNWWWHWEGPRFLFGGFGGTMFMTYIILWIVLPEANTASEKLEMRGEKVDLESIKNTIQEDLQGFQKRAQNFGSEFKEGAQNFAAEAGPAIKRTGSGLGHVIGVLFKAFFLFIAGVIAFSLFMALMGILFSGAVVYPLKNFFLDGFWQNALAWSSLILFLGVPVIGLVTWLIRRMMGVKSDEKYLGYVFGGLWIIGLVSALALASSLINDFRMKTSVNEEVAITQPASNKMTLKVDERKVKYYNTEFFDGDWPFMNVTSDSMLMNTARVKLVRSADTNYHVYTVKFGRGSNPKEAETNASGIIFPVNLESDVLKLPGGFPITKSTKYRAQQVLVVVEVPVGKKVEVDNSVDSYDWFDIDVNRKRGWNITWNEDWDNSYNWSSNVEYEMTKEGLKRTDGKDAEQNNTNQDWNKDGNSGDEYRYDEDQQRIEDSVRARIRRELREQDSLIREKTKEVKQKIEKKVAEEVRVSEEESEKRESAGLAFGPFTYLISYLR